MNKEYKSREVHNAVVDWDLFYNKYKTLTKGTVGWILDYSNGYYYDVKDNSPATKYNINVDESMAILFVEHGYGGKEVWLCSIDLSKEMNIIFELTYGILAKELGLRIIMSRLREAKVPKFMQYDILTYLKV